MADIPLSTLAGGGQLQLAPDLTWPSRKIVGNGVFERITGINGTPGGLVPALSLTGKYNVGFVYLSNLVNESITLKLTVDGVVIWNNTFTVGTTVFIAIGGGTGTVNYGSDGPYQCNTNFLLEITTITANNIICEFGARPIL